MKTLRTIWRRLMRDPVDLLALITVIAVLIDGILGKPSNYFYLMIFFGAMLILYIAGAIWRMGKTAEDLNEFVKDPYDRKILNLFPYEIRDDAWDKDLAVFIGVLLWLGLLITGLVLT